jgi:low temperature requirement protein LtrA
MSDNPKNAWWGPPKNFSERTNERKISWLELFYDLVYVAAIGQFTHHLSEHLSWPVLGYTFLLFALVFWSWVNGSQYYDLHGSDSIRTRFFTLWQMLAVAAVAITVNNAYEGYHKSFAIAFAVVELIINYLWWSAGIWDPGHRKYSIYYTINYTIAFVLLILSVFTSYETATIIWWIVLLLNLTPPLTGANAIVKGLEKRGEVFSASATLIERFGLFTIIVLAESILAIVNGIAEVKDKSAETWVAFILGVIITFFLWSLYFDMTSEQETKKGYRYLQWLIFLHFPILASFGIIGAGIKVLMENMNTVLPIEVQWVFCVALAIILIMIVCITYIMEPADEERSYIKPVSRLLITISVLILLVPFVGNYLHTISFLSVITFLLLVPVFVGVKSWVRFKFFNKD